MRTTENEFLDVRSETSVSSSTYTDGSFVGLFYTSKWGDFNRACQRITKFKPTKFRKSTDETVEDYSVRIKELEDYLNKICGHALFNLSYNNYKIQVNDPQYLDAIYAIRSEYKPRKRKDSKK